MSAKGRARKVRIAGMVLSRRRLVQVLSLLTLHSSWGPEAKWLCVPVLNCHSCALAWFACPIGVAIHYSGYRLFPLIAAGTILLLGTLFGRLFCGWACPFGFLQDMLHKIPSPKFRLPSWASYTKYLVLLLMVFAFPMFWGENTLFSFCRICPASALQVTIPHAVASGGHDPEDRHRGQAGDPGGHSGFRGSQQPGLLQDDVPHWRAAGSPQLPLFLGGKAAACGLHCVQQL